MAFNPGVDTSKLTAGLNKAQSGVRNSMSSGSGSSTFLLMIDPKADNATLYAKDFFFRFNVWNGENFAKTFGYEFVIYDVKTGQAMMLPLPLSPQNISMSIPAATQLTTTLKGIVEENNGAPLRSISINGTTGVTPVVPERANQKDNPLEAVARYLLKNTVNAGKNVVSKAKSVVKIVNNVLVNNVLGKNDKENRLNYNIKKFVKPSDGVYSGYKFFHELARLFDYYLAIKKTTDGKSKRLLFYMHKDQMYYSCTLNSFSFVKAAGTLEYQYSIQLTAWKRYEKRPTETNTGNQKFYQLKEQQTNAVAGFLQAVTAARSVLAAAQNVLTGFTADSKQALNGLFEVVALGKDLVGTVLSVAEFPEYFDAEISTHWDRLKNDSGWDALLTSTALIEYRPYDSSMLPTNMATSLMLSGGDYSVDSMSVSQETADLISLKIEEIRTFTPDDVRQRMERLESLASAVQASFGGDSETMNRVDGITRTVDTSKSVSADNLAILNALNDSITFMSLVIRNLQNTRLDNPDLSYILYYSDYAKTSGIQFEDAASKFFVPFPYGATLQSLSVQYLGDAERWIEIAAINGLREPYIDEEGFTINVLGLSAGVMTLAYNSDLYVGEVIEISSDLAPLKKKIKIVSITKNDPPSTMTVGYLGDLTVANYALSANPKILAYLPGTVGSHRMIAIPSAIESNVSSKIKVSPGASDLDKIVQMAGTDFLLSSSGDLVLGADDVKLATGYTNLVQAANIILRTKVQTLLQDPTFGVTTQVGDSIAEVNASAMLENINTMFASDPRFTGVEAGTVSVNAGVIKVDILVGVAAMDIHLPLSVQLPYGS